MKVRHSCQIYIMLGCFMDPTVGFKHLALVSQTMLRLSQYYALV